MRFEQYAFHPELKDKLLECGFRKPTDIQYKSIPPILKGEDVLAIAQTGTGKTAAFAIPLIERLLKKHQRMEAGTVRCLVMLPTRELAVQIAGVFQQFTPEDTLHILALIGGVKEDRQLKSLRQGIDVLISTPGRLFDLKSRGLLTLDACHFLVLDEADKMLSPAFIRDIHDVVKALPFKHQTLFFSATINEQIKDLAYSLVRNPIRIQLSPRDPVSKNIEHAVAFIEMDDKRFFLERLIREQNEKKILVFVRTRVRAERVLQAMKRVGIEALALHGNKDQEERLQVMEAYRKGDCSLLVATDVSARGIDIPGVHFVLNYDVPEIAENYVHRIGRTGRGFEKGQAWTFCSEEEKPLLDAIEEYIHKKIAVLDVSREDFRMTKALSEGPERDWKKLLEENEKNLQQQKRKKKS